MEETYTFKELHIKATKEDSSVTLGKQKILIYLKMAKLKEWRLETGT